MKYVKAVNISTSDERYKNMLVLTVPIKIF